MLLIAVLMTGYTQIEHAFSLASLHGGALSAEAAYQAGTYGDVAMGRDTVIIKPISIPTAPLPNHKPIAYSVKQKDTLESIARGFGLPWRQIVWSNPGLRLPVQAGQTLLVPPVPGVVVVVKAGDSAESLAEAYGVEPATILGFNRVRGTQLVAGSVLVIPSEEESSGPNLRTGLPADPIAQGQLMCPIPGADIIQKFGPTSFTLEPSFGGYLHFHTGVDLLAGYGTPIVAAAGGTVTAAGYADLLGLRVEITDSYGLVEIYGHMSQVSASVGQAVQQGARVGLVGSTGLSIGAHLHFQFEVGGMPVAPGALAGC